MGRESNFDSCNSYTVGIVGGSRLFCRPQESRHFFSPLNLGSSIKIIPFPTKTPLIDPSIGMETLFSFTIHASAQSFLSMRYARMKGPSKAIPLPVLPVIIIVELKPVSGNATNSEKVDILRDEWAGIWMGRLSENCSGIYVHIKILSMTSE